MDIIGGWDHLFLNAIAKCGILDRYIYNFAESCVSRDRVCTSTVITSLRASSMCTMFTGC